MKTLLGYVAVGVCTTFMGIIAGRYMAWQEREVPQIRTVQQVDLFPAVSKGVCTKQAVSQARELLRTCWHRRKSV